ncbi:hypothetical protein Pla52o_00940 [Novipirellula galeiformis]|uniref:Uncharacterized protein n=1 Tax=Novipirellula galeiformis TaxID=2528004 RepID=A0A5C6CS40_9BACT|nr:hypothetical protein Pla52o_00940 [Novipirellula galeiformis]
MITQDEEPTRYRMKYWRFYPRWNLLIPSQIVEKNRSHHGCVTMLTLCLYTFDAEMAGSQSNLQNQITT